MAYLGMRDRDIVSRSFRLLSASSDNAKKIWDNVDYDLMTSYFSNAPGDNKYVNPLPGFGFNTDPSPAMLGDGVVNSLGNLGRYHKRMFEDNALTLTLTACTAEFSGILNFINNMFDYSASLAANKGRAPGIAFYITQGAASIAFLPMQLLSVGFTFLGYLFNGPKSQWFYAKPAMSLYLASAQGLLNDLTVAAGYSLTVIDNPRQEQGNEVRGSRDYAKGGLSGYRPDDPIKPKEANIKVMSSLFPDSMNEDGTIDITKLITRGPRKTRLFLTQMKELDDSFIGTDTIITPNQKTTRYEGMLKKLINDPEFVNGRSLGYQEKGTSHYLSKELKTTAKQRGENELGNPEVASAYYSFEAANSIVPPDSAIAAVGKGGDYSEIANITQKYGYNANYNTNEAPSANSQTAAGDFTSESKTIPTQRIDVNKPAQQDSWLNTISEQIKDAFMGAADCVSFRIEGGTGSVRDSFSNETSSPEIASAFNGTVKAVNDFKYNVQGGNTGIDVVDTFMNTIKDGIAGIAAGSVIGNIPLALMGNSKIHLPEYWSDSSANLHSETFTITSRALYAHPYSITTGVFLPVALIAPFVFPIATGGGGYTTPFLVKAFSRGICAIRTGIVRNAEFEFGYGPCGWTRDKKPLNVRITLTIDELDKTVALPMNRITNPLDVLNVAKQASNYLGDIGGYNDWVNRVAGIDYLDSVLKFNDINRRVTRFTNDFQNIFSASNISNTISDSVIGDLSRLVNMRPLNR